jgi:hypothetical protein
MSLSLHLSQILELVGRLDDSPGDQNPRERFRALLKQNVTGVGQLRDFINECLANTGEQYNHALQDLINHLGTRLGFDVTFGRYRGVVGEIGHDGLWKSPDGFYIVVEVKTSETYPINTADLVNYVDRLISQKTIPDWRSAMGLYVIGRPNPDVKQLENSIIAENNVNRMRIISVESLLALAEMMSEYGVNHEDVLGLLRPSRPTIDPTIDIMKHLFAQPPAQGTANAASAAAAPHPSTEAPASSVPANCWLTPVRDEDNVTAEQIVKDLVVEKSMYAFGDTTPNKTALRPGDGICFYASGKGVVAHATVKSQPVRNPNDDSEGYPWEFSLGDAQYYADNPVVIDVDLRTKLDAFKSSNAIAAWGWFVVTTRLLSRHDYELLTRQGQA